jgi:hypothetical protein
LDRRSVTPGQLGEVEEEIEPEEGRVELQEEIDTTGSE